MATFATNPAVSSLDGTEAVPLSQGGIDKRATTQAIADLASPLASNVIYEPNSNSPITADNVQDALEEVAAMAGGAVSSVNGDTGTVIVPQAIIIACSDETTNVTTGTAKVTFRMPYAFTLTEIPRASVTTAQTAGSILTFDINESGTTILSTKITIDNSEKTSTTAATPAVLSDTSLANDAEMTVDFDQVGTALAKGVKITLIGYPT